MLKNVRMMPKLILFFLLVGLLPLMLTGWWASRSAEQGLVDRAMDALLTAQNVKKSQVLDLIDQASGDIHVLAESEDVLTIYRRLFEYHLRERVGPRQAFPVNSEEYLDIASSRNTYFNTFMVENHYDDIYLICSEHGHVMYTYQRAADLGANIAVGGLRDSLLADVWREVVETKDTVFTDFEPYEPKQGRETAFLGQPLYDGTGELYGVVVVEFSRDALNEIVQRREGMGETGETYLIAEHDGDLEFRSTMLTMGQGRYVIGEPLDNPPEYWMDALETEVTGQGVYTDSEGTKVLIVYDSMDVLGQDWAIISKIDYAEVARPADKLRLSIVGGSALLLAAVVLAAIYFARSITRPLVRDVEFAKAVAAGDLDVHLELDQQDELGDLAHALNAMAVYLRREDWFASGKLLLDDSMRGVQNVRELTERTLASLVEHLGAQMGAVYLPDQDDSSLLRLASSHAFTDRRGNFNTVRLGEGLVGQAALERKTIIFSNVTENAPALNYGAGEKIPEHFLIAPVVFEGDLASVVLLASVTPFGERERDFVKENVANVAVMLSQARSREVIRDLLEQAQQQAEELQSQQEELEQVNEELREQTEALKESESSLQSQQEELRVMNEELEERTKDLEEQKAAISRANKALQSARNEAEAKARELEESGRYKTEFLANMSHELRTPLNSILILSQLLEQNREGNLTDKQVESAQAIHSSGADLLALINDILDLSKVEAGKMEVKSEEVRIEAVVGELERVFRDQAAAKGLSLGVEVAPEAPRTLETDSVRLQQILRNLVSNAVKFTEQGGVTMAVKPAGAVEAAPPAGIDPESGVVFEVVDTGIGIPPDKQELVFEAFQQADGTTSRKYGGTGLGLAISRRLARLLGGELVLESEAGTGATFRLFLPAKARVLPASQARPKPDTQERPETRTTAPGPAATSAAPTAGVEPAPRPEPPICPKNPIDAMSDEVSAQERSLLVVEDDPEFARVLVELARERGFKVLAASHGERGLHLAGLHKPDAIILDVGLPGMDGWEVMERLKSSPELRHIPVHFISAMEEPLQAMRMGAIGFLSKPVSVEKISNAFGRIEQAMERPVKNLLVVEDDETQRQSIIELIGNGDVLTTGVGSAEEALELLRSAHFDCVILDLGLQDSSGFQLLDEIRADPEISSIPVIIYTGKDISREDETRLKKHAESIIIKGAKSPQRLLDETNLFLHRVESELPDKQRKLLMRGRDEVLKGRKVLIADDDMRNVFALTSLLEEQGLEVVAAMNGRDALDKLAQHEDVDLVLMDIMMPEMDGYEAIRAIRKDADRKRLPIIALTAKAMKGDRAKCIEVGANDYLAKPVDFDRLMSLLRVWLYR
jgi:tubulin-specific chaperone A